MADVEIKFESEKVQRFFEDITKGVDSVVNTKQKYVDLIGTIVFKDVQEHFEKEEGETGPWQAWSKIYAEHMARIGRSGNKLLQNSGRLRQSFLPSNVRTRTGEMQFYNPAKTSQGFPYAYAHDTGGPKLPKRDFMWLSKRAMGDVADSTLAFIMGE